MSDPIATLREILVPQAGADPNAVRLVAILCLSNAAEQESDPFRRRIALNEMQAAIQSVRADLEVLAEGLIFIDDDA